VLFRSKLKHVTSVKFLRIIYFSLFQSHIQYCLPVYGSAFPSIMNSLFLVQKKCIRQIGVNNTINSTNALFKEFDIMPLKALYYYRCYCYIKKHYNLCTDSLRINRRNLTYANNNVFHTTRAHNTLQYRKTSLLNKLRTNLLEMNKTEIKKHCLWLFENNELDF